ncbi:MAG: hypothetical protein VX642_01455, partial [Bdellovibrionota bacterium]|nr:hypothetical protein [Bdellovibrionota bacterium]
MLNPIHGIQNSEKIHSSEGLFLISSLLNLVVFFVGFVGRGDGAALAPQGGVVAFLVEGRLFF